MKLPMSIRKFLPHREPMLMVDDILAMDDSFIETNFKIKSCNIFLEDNYLSEIGIIENAAQTSSGIVGRPYFEDNKSNKDFKIMGYISKIKSVKIFKLPPVDALLITRGELISNHHIGDVFNCNMKCNTYIGDEKIAESYFNLIIKV
jgi:predicted hotdog family 3-hydroxylacyl-ACP dehydratase